MGLFDALQSAGGSPGGGLLDFLRQYAAQNGAQPQSGNPSIDPSAAQNPYFANSPPMMGQAAMQSAPVAPMPPSLISAQPNPGQQAPAQQAAPAFLQPQTGLNGFISGMRDGGLVGGIQGMLGGGPAEAQRQNQNATYQALLKKGVDPETAQAAMADPELRKTVFNATFGKDSFLNAGNGKIFDTKTQKYITDPNAEETSKWGVVGKDKFGQPVYGYPPSREDYAAGKSGPGNVPDASSNDLTDVHGQPYLDALKTADPKYASQVQAVIEGRAPYPTGMLLKTPYGQKLAQDVTQADPSFESGNATARVKVRNEFESGGVGSPAGQISAGNTALQHAGEMSDALERMKANPGMMGLGEAGVPFLSYYANKAHNAAVQGTPEGKAYNDFMTAKNHFSEEVTKFYAGSAGSEAERARALANLDAAKSLPELRSAIKTEANLMQGKVNALQSRWRTGMGPLVQDFPLISSESQGAVDRVLKRDTASEAGGTGAAQPAFSEGMTATNPQTGQKLTFRGGKWQ